VLGGILGTKHEKDDGIETDCPGFVTGIEWSTVEPFDVRGKGRTDKKIRCVVGPLEELGLCHQEELLWGKPNGHVV
jgi:hypothetical protein